MWDCCRSTIHFLPLPHFIVCYHRRSLRRHGQYPEKVNRGMILSPLAGIILNLLDASAQTECKAQNDVVGVFASMDCLDTVHCGFQYLLEYNWVSSVILTLSLSLSHTHTHTTGMPNSRLHKAPTVPLQLKSTCSSVDNAQAELQIGQAQPEPKSSSEHA